MPDRPTEIAPSNNAEATRSLVEYVLQQPGLSAHARSELLTRMTNDFVAQGVLPDLTLSAAQSGRRAADIAGANNVLQHPENFGGNHRPGTPQHESFLRLVASSTDVLRVNGQLTGIEQGKPGQMPDLIAEYARTHFNALSGNTANITRESLRNYINHTGNLSPFARDILTQMQERFDQISDGSSRISLGRLETYKSNAAVAREAMEYLGTDAGWRTFAGAEANGTTRTYIHRDHVGQQMQNFENRLREPNLSTADRAHYERMQRIGQHLLTQISTNTWDNHVNWNSGINSVTEYARTRGYRAGDFVNPPVQATQPAPEVTAPRPQPAPPYEVIRPYPSLVPPVENRPPVPDWTGFNPPPIREPERTSPWQQRVNNQILGNNGFVGEESYQAAASRARQTGLPLVIAFGREDNQAILQGARDRLQRGEAVVLYTDGIPRPNTYLGQVYAAAGEWIGQNGGAIRVDTRANTFTAEQLIPRRTAAATPQVNDSQRCEGPTCPTPIARPQETYVANGCCPPAGSCGSGCGNVVQLHGRPLRRFLRR
ncbi:MAG: hypothetical protein HYX67_06260 [Candidatus Melainabacteria bacterium]|nr:hypothetical protein [Candidatus Melainabacteria bacterium]